MEQTNTFVEIKYGNISKGIKQWKSSVERYRVKDKLVEKRYFTKPSEKKRLEKQAAIYKQKTYKTN